MAIRIRKVDGHVVALCAAETKREPRDLYLDDTAHHALYEKFRADYVKMGFIKKERQTSNLDYSIALLVAEGKEIARDAPASPDGIKESLEKLVGINSAIHILRVGKYKEEKYRNKEEEEKISFKIKL